MGDLVNNVIVIFKKTLGFSSELFNLILHQVVDQNSFFSPTTAYNLLNCHISTYSSLDWRTYVSINSKEKGWQSSLSIAEWKNMLLNHTVTFSWRVRIVGIQCCTPQLPSGKIQLVNCPGFNYTSHKISIDDLLKRSYFTYDMGTWDSQVAQW